MFLTDKNFCSENPLGNHIRSIFKGKKTVLMVSDSKLLPTLFSKLQNAKKTKSYRFAQYASFLLSKTAFFALPVRSFRLIFVSRFRVEASKRHFIVFSTDKFFLLFIVSKNRLDEHICDQFSKERHF